MNNSTIMYKPWLASSKKKNWLLLDVANTSEQITSGELSCIMYYQLYKTIKNYITYNNIGNLVAKHGHGQFSQNFLHIPATGHICACPEL